MVKLLNILAISGLVGTAAWAYSIKYDTLYFAEQVKKLERQLDRETQAIAVLKAEWQHINSPGRLQLLNDRHLGLTPLQASQIIRVSDLPARQPRGDVIGQKIDALITGSIPAASTSSAPTPAKPGRPSGRTPGAQ
jgi:hypothetical protein